MVMTPKEINRALMERGYNQTIIAAALNPPLKNPSSVSAVINRANNSRRIAKAIAKILGKEMEEVFGDVPEYFHDRSYQTINKLQRQQKIEEIKLLLAS